MEALHKYLRVSGPEEMNELRKIASRFEEKIFSDAVNLVTLPSSYVFCSLSVEIGEWQWTWIKKI